MPNKPPRQCPRCRNIVFGSWCRTCKPAWSNASTSSHITNTSRWRNKRRQVLREEPMCRMCGMVANQVDHIIELADGGEPWARTNLQPLCARCHRRKTRAEQRDRDARRRQA